MFASEMSMILVKSFGLDDVIAMLLADSFYDIENSTNEIDCAREVGKCGGILDTLYACNEIECEKYDELCDLRGFLRDAQSKAERVALIREFEREYKKGA